MSEKYPDTTLDAKFESIEEKMDDHFEATTTILKDLAEKVGFTNGKVRSLQLWRQFILGGISVLIVIVVPTLGFLAYQVIQNQAHISALNAKVQDLQKP